MLVKKQFTKKELDETELREFSRKAINSIRLFSDLEFKIKNVEKDRYIRSDSCIKHSVDIFMLLKKAVEKDDKLNLASLIDDIMVPAISKNLSGKKLKLVLFDTRSNILVERSKEISTLQRKPPEHKANKLTDDESFESDEIKRIATSHITESESLVDSHERALIEGYMRALISRYSYADVVSAMLSAKKKER